MGAVLNAVKFVAAGWPTRVLAALLAIAIGMFVYIVSLISVIGLPIAIMMLALPGAASLYIASELIHQAGRLFIRPPSQATSRLVGAALVIASSFIVAQVANFRLAASARSLAAGDFDEPGTAKIRSLALAGENIRESDRFIACTELCLRLLINGSVEEVMMTGPIDPAVGVESGAKAIAARFEKQGDCAVKHYFPSMSEALAKRNKERRAAKATYDEARRRQESGVCLVETAAPLGRADAVLASAKTKKGQSPYRAGFDPFADTAGATRLSFYRRAGGKFEERSRRTIVRYKPLLFLAVPTYLHGYGMDLKVGFARYPAYVNAAGGKSARQAPTDFLANRLGLDLGSVNQ
ncbi:MAG: hypothetical protein AB7F91_12535 [Parvularculaceae bacterium]